jgi:integrase
VDFFGADKLVRDITAGAADNYKMHLIGEKLAPMTVRKRLQFAKMIFRAMVKHRLIESNPFAEVKFKATMDPARQRFITREETTKLLAACPNWEWRLIVALARYGGLRCPSEILSLRVGDINWEANRICVTSPKTEHHPGKGSRMIPLFPELRPYLDEAFDAVPEGVEYILARFRSRAIGPKGWRNCNLRTTMEKIIKRAGLVPWPRLFHNMRASRETELSERFPIKVVTAWIGNTPDIAMQHYLQVTDEHWQRALEGDGNGQETNPAEVSPCSALQNPVQSVAVLAGTGSYENEEIPGKTRFSGDAARCETDGEGFEPPVDSRPQQFSRLPP